MEFTNDWELYEKGIDFKNRINLYKEVEDNNRFFQGDQWHGVKSEGLPTPVFNIIKPVIRYKVSAVMQNNIKISYSSENYNEKNSEKMNKVCELLTNKAEILWEQLKMDFHNEELLKDSAISGDGIAYFYYDDEKDKIKLELIDNTNIYPSNPNYANIQQQDYIIIAFRRTVDSVREEALSNGVKKELTESIVSDDDTLQTAGALGKI
ncbi:MAG: phage portal protein, partial [Clostridia bacterium]|nr:phage portal protein [Clostridia bacterium]